MKFLSRYKCTESHLVFLISIVCAALSISAFALIAADLPSQWEVKRDLIPTIRIQKNGSNEVCFLSGVSKTTDPEKDMAAYLSSCLLKSDATPETVSWKSVSGHLVKTKTPLGIRIIIIVSDGTRIWQGEYFGEESHWPDFLNILKTIELKQG